jgi:hypothetical protein
VNTLQFIKCAIRQDLLFQEPAPSSKSEVEETSDQEPENMGAGGEPSEESDVEEFSWDGLLIEDEDEEAMSCSD